ncbi:MAG TPA: DUF6569 family protein [Verrucomicrobiae bacterium]|nr:DUF6569 family protein [Verrucomicrobiae bacterium]
MDALIRDYLSSLRLGAPQQFKNMTAVPLFSSLNHGPEYLTLQEAMDKDLVSVAEVSLGGSVPQLKVINRSELPVLLVDGEELVGAKQNRVLNTSILLVEKSETIIPVSCTEHGRWSYTSPKFNYAAHIVGYKLRKMNSTAVGAQLKTEAEAQGQSARQKRPQAHHSYSSDQTAVWQSIDQAMLGAKVESPSHALNDVFAAKAAELEAYLNAFPWLPDQKGMLVCINGEVAGLDLISFERAYKVLHPTLVKSFAIGVLIENMETAAPPSMDKASGFLHEAMQCSENRYPSIGYGTDHRLRSQKIAGSALVARDRVIHVTLFRN